MSFDDSNAESAEPIAVPSGGCSADSTLSSPPFGGAGQLRLNEGQQQALDAIGGLIDWFSCSTHGQCGSDRAFSITGHAGTGKTVLIAAAHNRWLGEVEIHVLVPNHKVRTLNEARLRRAGHPLASVMTLHSALGYREVNKGKGEAKFAKAGKPKLAVGARLQLLLVDEAGMLPAEMWQHLLDAADEINAVVVCLGDGEQLPPIDEATSPALQQDITYLPWTEPAPRLTQQMRATGAIYSFAQEILDCEDVTRMEPYRGLQMGGSSVLVMLRAEAEARFLEEVRERSQRGEVDSVRFIAARNDTIDSLDVRSHRAQFGRGAARYVPGQALLTRAPIWSKDADLSDRNCRAVIGTSAELTVREAYEDTLHLEFHVAPFSLWHLLVQDDETGEKHWIYTDSPSFGWVVRLQKLLLRYAKNHGMGEDGRFTHALTIGECWRAYWTVTKLLGHRSTIRWASTCHRAQGSEFASVYVHWEEILSMANWVEKDEPPNLALAKSAAYTACTRAQKTLVLAV